MKKNEKGFTLIELLAVIVILAVIAIIATPIVINSINEARKGAAEDSTYGVIEAVKTYYAEKMLDASAGDNFYIKWETSGNNTTVKAGTKSEDANSISDFKLSGTKPKGGSITIDSNGDVEVENLVINGYKCNGNSDKVTCNKE